MITKRIIPCLDVDKGRVVKGVRFTSLRDAGDPVQLAKYYYKSGADELTFLDITASNEKRDIFLTMVKKVAKEIFIPFTVGGGIRSIQDARNVLYAGADKFSINSAAIKNPKIISDCANLFGSQCVVVAIDAKRKKNNWEVFINGGRIATGIDVLVWAKTAVENGAGEILLTSMDQDGTKNGYDIELTKFIAKNISVPVIASGGAGEVEDFVEVFSEGFADTALAASLFHFGEVKIQDVKEYLKKKDIPVRDEIC